MKARRGFTVPRVVATHRALGEEPPIHGLARELPGGPVRGAGHQERNRAQSAFGKLEREPRAAHQLERARRAQTPLLAKLGDGATPPEPLVSAAQAAEPR